MIHPAQLPAHRGVSTRRLQEYNAPQAEMHALFWAPGRPHTEIHLSDNLDSPKGGLATLKTMSYCKGQEAIYGLRLRPLLPTAAFFLVVKKSEGECTRFVAGVLRP